MALRDLTKKKKIIKSKKDTFIQSYKVGKEIKGKYKDTLFTGILKRLVKSTYTTYFPTKGEQSLVAFDIEFKEALPCPMYYKALKGRLPKYLWEDETRKIKETIIGRHGLNE